MRGYQRAAIEAMLAQPATPLFVEPSWVPAAELQSRDRLHRGIPRDSRGAVDWGVVSYQRDQEFERFKMMGEIQVRQQVQYYRDLAWMEKSWLTKKFLTIAAKARTFLKRSQQRNED